MAVAKTCEEYVLQMVEAIGHEMERLEDEVAELREELETYRDPRMQKVIEVGRAELFGQVRCRWANEEPMDGEAFAHWAERMSLTGLVPEVFGGFGGFLDYFSDEYQSLYADLCREKQEPVEG